MELELFLIFNHVVATIYSLNYKNNNIYCSSCFETTNQIKFSLPFVTFSLPFILFYIFLRVFFTRLNPQHKNISCERKKKIVCRKTFYFVQERFFLISSPAYKFLIKYTKKSSLIHTQKTFLLYLSRCERTNFVHLLANHF